MPKNFGLPWLATEKISKPAAVVVLGEGDTVQTISDDDGKEEGQSLSGKKVKYSCPTKDCKLNVWGKPGLNVVCGDCGGRLKVNNSKPKKKGRLATLSRVSQGRNHESRSGQGIHAS
jgi:hypothetical protein